MVKRTKAGGRQLGTPNKVSGDLRHNIQLLLTDQWPEFMRRLSRLDDDSYCRVISGLFPYVMPKQKEIQATISGGGGFAIILPNNQRDSDFNPADLDEL